ncbi:hypothetical protein BWX39_03325 [Prevotella intermedia ATCC 25611 = DSM 20706]|jgi:hypothetical protein|uniref:Uncharacterized protein n=1 Tax=Prevotella intermedia ZT TaxID=1347790 RepID=A0AAP0YWV2_PREIN|nr:hypothetical protein [Prevotella intermedia]APW31757.1 hypothetical protein BWX39_03325 [Prevotella intermedia ATCC 25611 = DSM 20706]KJJ88037.1 hypothetical protein M573_102152 [Prevotella intermedia ZT]SUB96289.1 Uncharacterised protein [Prevotella intermedia]
MCIAKEIFDFALKGVKTFRQASLGNFNEESEEVKHLKEEIMNNSSSTSTDRQNLRSDQRAIYGDVRKTYNKIVIDNV